jgi:hypothetical protein
MKDKGHILALAKTINILYKEKNKSLKPLGHRFNRLVREILWAATEDQFDTKTGKAKNRKWKQSYWTLAAIRQCKKNRDRKKKNRKLKISPFKGLQHEHVIPKQDFIRAFERNHSIKNILELLDKAEAAIVTERQHKKLNNSKKRGGTRYKDKNIKVFQVKEWKKGGLPSIENEEAGDEFYKLSIRK